MSIAGYVRYKLLNPRTWGRSVACAVTWSTIAGAIVGFTLSWVANRPVPPWIEFDGMSALYEHDGIAISLSGLYTVNTDCIEASGLHPIWRIEALATDGELALYGPKPQAPILVKGEHRYSDFLPLQRPIEPDGWRVTIIATCPGMSPETVASEAFPIVMTPATPR